MSGKTASGKATPAKAAAQHTKAQDISAEPAGGGSGPNEGEGSQTGARQYDEATRAFVAAGKVGKAAAEAEKDMDGPEADSLKRAEADGKSHSHGEDPLLRK